MSRFGWRSLVGLAVCFFFFFFFFLQLETPLVAAQRAAGNASSWQTLDGSRPKVVARGGLSGVFPGSSSWAYSFANDSSFGIPGVIQWCDLQLTKDGIGLCLPSVDLGNCTGIRFSNLKPTNETLDGTTTSGYFSYNYNYANLSRVGVVQGIYSRTAKFDNLFITTLDYLGGQSLQGLWVNIQNDVLYKRHNLNMTRFLISRSNITIDYISSPEVAFLNNAARIIGGRPIKFIFRFLGKDETEKTTNQTYDSLKANLTFIKTFASGILVPKNYIWPTSADLYLQEHTSIVSDAHEAGLEIYAADFANDAIFAYNYSYNPILEYLNFIDNKENFSVDGVLTDFPTSASAAIGCFSHTEDINDNGKPLVISHNGASGMYPDCTNLAYDQAVDDDADFIDCPVQVTQDGVLICQSSVDLIQTTTIATSPFQNRLSRFPQIKRTPGIFTFNLTWEEIQDLKPKILNPYLKGYRLFRNPAYKNAGSFMKLSDFLEFAKGKPSTGIVISIENAAFLVENIGVDIIGSVIKTLDDHGYNDSETSRKVMIQSADSSVLIEFKGKRTYDCLYEVDELIGNADSSSIQAIRSFADAVAVKKSSIFRNSDFFFTNNTELVKTLKAGNLSVYVYVLRNEFVSMPWDFLSDPTVAIHNFVEGGGVDGIITDFPGSGALYKKRTCTNDGDFRLPLIPPGFLISLMPKAGEGARPPALSPLPTLNRSDVAQPPLTSFESPPTLSGFVDSMPPGRSILLVSLVSLIVAFLLIVH